MLLSGVELDAVSCDCPDGLEDDDVLSPDGEDGEDDSSFCLPSWSDIFFCLFLSIQSFDF